MTIPTKKDINPDSGCLDQIWALKNFYGKSQDEAAALFFEGADYYLSDILWMGDKAFIYYVPSIKPYLFSAESKGDSIFISALLLAIKRRLENSPKAIQQSREDVLDILRYVLEHGEKFDVDIDSDGDLIGVIDALIQAIEALV